MERQWQNPEDGERSFPLPYRVYEGKADLRPQPLVLYLRGHAFIDQERAVADSPVALALADAGALVVEADYGGPSGSVFPKTLECGFSALKYLVAKRKRFAAARSPLLLVGDEAGGNLAASLALKARDYMRDELAGQVLLSPMIDPRMVTGSFNRADGIGMRTRWSDGWNHYLASACGYQHPYAAPCLCSRLTGVAPALVVTSDDDPLRDETLDYAARLQAADVPVTTRILPDTCGWTGIYNGQNGEWRSLLCAEFSRFLRDLPS